MSRVLLQPASSGAPRLNYEKTIRRSVPLSEIAPHLSATENTALAAFYPGGAAQVWGLTPTRGIGIHPQLRQGDPALFYGSGIFYAFGFVTFKVRSAALADFLWGQLEADISFEYVYFLKDVRPSSVPLFRVSSILGRSANWRVMGAELLGEDVSAQIAEDLELFSEEVPAAPTEGEYRRAISPPAPGAQLDREVRSKQRVEQAYLRDTMLGRRSTAHCAICGEEFSVRNLVVAHIKKRSNCTPEEKMDVANIALPMCKCGCDMMFESRAIIASDGTLASGSVDGMTPHERALVQKLSGRKVGGYSQAMEKYFIAHRERL